MSSKTFFARRVAAVSPLVFAVALAAAPGAAHAQGFFEQLFGGGAPARTPAPTYDYPDQQQQLLPGASDPSLVRRHRKIADADARPVRQKTTDLMHDTTLRYGDAVMMKDGVHIYSGPGIARHTRDQFLPLDEARVSKAQRGELVAMDMTRRDPLAYAPLREGRSGSDGKSTVLSDALPISSGYKITDAQGKSVRYVGP